MEAVGYAFEELGEKGVAGAFESTLKVLVDAILIQVALHVRTYAHMRMHV